MEQLLSTEKFEDTELTPIQLPVSELFCNFQGEGCFAGQSQIFVRTAGCTVGKPYLKSEGFPIYTDRCTFSDGREFPCDTDYRKKMSLTVNELLNRISEWPRVKTICLTGGEPLMHQRRLKSVLMQLKARGYTIHCETSGTIELDEHSDIFWVTVSPKKGILPSMITRGNEFKILVDSKFHPDLLPFDLEELSWRRPCFLQPINGERTVNADNLKLCIEWQKKLTNCRISPQMHKVVEHFVQERML